MPPARRRGANLNVLGPLFAAALLVFFSQAAWPERVHPELDAQLSTLPPGQAISVIVEMFEPGGSGSRRRQRAAEPRMARRRAVRDRLQILANEDQAAILALLTREQSLGNVHRLRRFWCSTAWPLRQRGGHSPVSPPARTSGKSVRTR